MKKKAVLIQLLRIYFNTIGKLFKKQSAKQLIKLFSTPQSRVIRNKEIEVLKKAKKSSFQFKDKEVCIYEWGHGDDYVLLCHGWESNAGSLGAFVEPLITKGYKIISYDGPAHGRSEGGEASLITFKAVAKEVVKRYGKPLYSIGHSLGANVIILLSYEEKLPISKNILIAPVNQIKTVFDGFKKIFLIPNSIFEIMIRLVSERADYNLEKLKFSELGQKSPLENILILHDQNDQITDYNHSKSMVNEWEKAELKTINGSGHYKILWNKDTLNSVLKHLI